MADVDFNYWLSRKYALLQQQADAGTSNASSQAISAVAGANQANAGADLTRVQTKLAPAESAAQIGLQGANARLLGVQADVLPSESAARVANLTAETALTGTNNKIAIREGLTPRSIMPGALGSVLGGRGLPSIGGSYQGYRLPVDAPLPPRAAGESEAAYLDRINS